MNSLFKTKSLVVIRQGILFVCIMNYVLFHSVHQFLQPLGQPEKNNGSCPRHDDKEHKEIVQGRDMITHQHFCFAGFRIISAKHACKLIGRCIRHVPHTHQQ